MNWLYEPTNSLRPIDSAIAAMLSRRFPGLPSDLLAVFAAASRHAGYGNTALDLSALEWAVPDYAAARDMSALSELTRRLRTCPVVGDGSDGRPFVLEEGLLYLRRFHRDEVCLAERLRFFAGVALSGNERLRISTAWSSLFPGVEDPLADPSSLACLVSLVSRLTVVLGGPGTGKTTVVARMLDLHRGLYGDNLRIAVAAPTGKAAARVGEAVTSTFNRFGAGASDREHAPLQAMTLHRLLGARADGMTFRYGIDDRLPYDLVIVDEASMVDQALFRRLLEALQDDSRLVVLGDPDQLEAIESGAVLAELAKLAVGIGNRAARARIESVFDDTNPVSGAMALESCIVRLERNWRFSPDSGIGRLSEAIRSCDLQGASALLEEGLDDLVLVDSRKVRGFDYAGTFVGDRYREALATGRPDNMLRAHAGFRVLAATRVEAAQANLAAAHRLGQRWRGRYAEVGMPFIIERNDPLRRLYNGDTGVFWWQGNELQAALAAAPGASHGTEALRSHAVGDIGSWLPAYAMTVHRAQGAEYDDVLILLPKEHSALLSRSWLYTAVSRARDRLFVCGNRSAVAAAIDRSAVRTSGLAARLLRD